MPSSKSKPKPKLNFEAIGTVWEIELSPEATPRQLTHVQRRVVERIEEFNLDYSRFRPDSLVSLMAKTAGTYDLPPDAEPMFDLYHELYELTGGALTPLIGGVLSDAGYDANYSLQPGELHPTPSWDEALDYNFPHLTLKRPALLDLGAAGKGYLVDIVGAILREEGIEDYCVDAGGDMAYRGPEPLKVGLEHPTNPKQAIGVAQLASGRSLCGSAGNRRAWAGYHHIIDPRTQSSPTNILAIWTEAETTLLADALTTALYFAPAKQLASRYDFQYAIIHADYSLEYSPHFPATFF